jgi:hypothetical protein
MKATRWDDLLSGSESLSSKISAPRGPDDSLFSLLLELENRLREDSGNVPGSGSARGKPKLKGFKPFFAGSLSRYVE